jgi:hypothetical protein
VQDLYTASKDNQAFLHARLGLGDDQLQPFKTTISRWIAPDLMKGQSISISKAKKAIADYKKAIGRPEGLAELSIFYCEEATGFLESCSMDDEKYFAALIRMYGRSLEILSSLLLPSAVPTSSVSSGLGHAGGVSAGWSRKNSIAFGMMRWTSSRVNERSFCGTRETNEAAGVHYIDP